MTRYQYYEVIYVPGDEETYSRIKPPGPFGITISYLHPEDIMPLIPGIPWSVVGKLTMESSPAAG